MDSVKEKIITLAIGTLAVTIVIGSINFVNFLLGEPEEKVLEQIIQPNFTKEDIEKIKEQEIAMEDEKNKIIKFYRDLPQIDIYENGLVTPVSLIQACEDKKKIPGKCNEEIARITKILKTTGEITQAYLYIKAGVSRGGLPLGNLTEKDSIYLYVDDAQKYGGHLLRSQAKWTQVNEDSIELLFDLKSVPLTHLPYNDMAEPDKTPSLIDVLNQPNRHFIAGFVSTLGYGKIFEFKIGYSGGRIEKSI